ncbi:MAG: rod shape-determining protein MreC [Candidatus Wolfebacteria bacterium]|nr:rod shape-determining protein MreC [Candidatus Wolfebacteria bacterium]
MRNYIIVALIVVLVFVTYFTDFFFARTGGSSEVEALRQENQDLLAQIQRYAMPNFKQSDLEQKSISARVFSVYPFNVKNLITVDIGEKAGIRPSMPVASNGNILIGKVKDVYSETSVIQTVFDPGMQLSVRIGKDQVDGFFQGGSEPKITLVEKSKSVGVGDFVYSAGSDFPYGLKIGEVSDIKESSAGIFKEIGLKMPFNISELREVNILVGN